MCFTPFVSWATAGLGLSIGIITKARGKSATLYLPPIYFGSMELLQGLMYTQLHHSFPIFVNLLIYTAYVHVCFQPFIINYWLGSFINKKQQAIYHFTLKLCFIGGLFLLARIIMSESTPLCSSYETLCSATPKIFHGFYHIAWSLPLKGAGLDYVTPSIALHMFLFFIPGILLGFYRVMAVFFIFGPYLSSFITSNPSEQSSIWCVIGLWLLVITIISTFFKPPHFLFPDNSADRLV